MSFVTDQIRRIDAQLDRIQLLIQDASSSAAGSHSSEEKSSGIPSTNSADEGLRRQQEKIDQLHQNIKALSVQPSSSALLRPERLQALLDESVVTPALATTPDRHARYEDDLEWVLIGKAAMQTYGLVLNTVLDQVIPLSNDIWYWDQVLTSSAQTGVSYYYLQTAPLRLWARCKDVYQDVRGQISSLEASEFDPRQVSLQDRWSRYWSMVSTSIHNQSLQKWQSNLLSPLTQCRIEIRRKQKRLQGLREMSACTLGILKNEALHFDINDADSVTSASADRASLSEDWKHVITKSVVLIAATLNDGVNMEQSSTEFEDQVFAEVDHRTDTADGERSVAPAALAQSLSSIVQVQLPTYVNAMQRLASQNCRPSLLVRAWPTLTGLLVGSGIVVTTLYHRKADVVLWIRNVGTTMQDFWTNWVWNPVVKTIGTIRHDADSDIALMSRESLEGDRQSLERMVVDFAVDHRDVPATSDGSSNATALDALRAKVREGDLSPVLRAYEKDLRSPFWGTVRGDLIRALLIQVQKTKVDVEVAMKGIDNLLRSQELVFACVGLTPGVLISFGLLRWLANLSGARGSRSRQKSKARIVRLFRNVDRILNARHSTSALLSFKEYGLLLCELQLIRQDGQRILPTTVNKEFVEDLSGLADLHAGVEWQRKTLERIRWAYWQWL